MFGGNFAVNGGRNGANEILLDGVPAAPPSDNGNRLTVFPSVDAVEEFRVQTNNFSAECGNSGGGLVNVVDDWAETATFLQLRVGQAARLARALGSIWVRAYIDAGRVVIGGHNVAAARMCDQGCCAAVILRRRHRKPGFSESGRRLRGRLSPLGPSSNSLRLQSDTGCALTPHARVR
jgi:hypothetical protein